MTPRPPERREPSPTGAPAPPGGGPPASAAEPAPVGGGVDPAPAVAGVERIGRDQLQRVIRRAAELYASEAESGERLAPAEVLRIAEELGLPSRHVRQALYELPLATRESGLLDRWCGEGHLVISRAVPREPSEVLGTLERYLVLREYLQVRRRQAERLMLVPAGDTVTSVARAFRRPKSRHYLAHARTLGVAAQPLDPGTAHVQVDLDLTELRSGYVAGGVVGGVAAGAAVGTGVFFAVALSLGEVLGVPAAAGVGVVGGLGGLTGSVALSLRMAARRFRLRATDARLEVEGLLDRVERGEPLEPPPSPVRKWLLGG